MTQEQKDLLLKDLSSRLPYKVKVQIPDRYGDYIPVIESIDIDGFVIDSEGSCFEVEKVKPYLFPLSSMTEEQALELYKLFGIKLTDSIGWDYIKINEVTGITFFLRKGFDVETHLDKLIDWLLKNHFDFRGLIPKGLAIDATNLNIY